MARLALWIAVALLQTTLAVHLKHDEVDRQPFDRAGNDVLNTNSSLVEGLLEVPAVEVPGFYDQLLLGGNSPNQWRLPDMFKRQAASCSNYCGPTQSAPRTYCGCGSQCCSGGTSVGCCATASGQQCCNRGFCCNTASGASCCGTACCANGATCNANSACAFRTTVVPVTATAWNTQYRDITQVLSANGGTVTITSTYSSVTIVTVSSADVATIVTATTVTQANSGAKKARNVHGLRPADKPEQPLETSASAEPVQKAEQDVLAPQITEFPPSPNILAKRQTSFVSTVTSTVSTVTSTTTITRVVTQTVAARGTATSSITVWQTVTSFINAKSTKYSTTTYTFTPGQSAPSAPTTTGGGGGGNNDGSNQDPNQVPQGGSKGLSKGAQAGIGAGTGAGSLIICIIIAFWCRRRRKSRKEQNQEMIDNAVTTAMAAQQKQGLPQTPGSPQQYYDGKHLSTATHSTASPHPYSPSPPIHSPQPTYVYPPPPGHGLSQPVYEAGPTATPHQNMAGLATHSPYSSGAPTYGGSEIDGSPVHRYEMAQYNSPPPMHPAPHSDAILPQQAPYGGENVPHPGPYMGPGHQQGYRR